MGGTYLVDTPIFEMLSAPPSGEPTAISLRVKPECQNAFEYQFNKMFGQQYKLYSKEDIISSQLFGLGHPNPRLSSFVGDYFDVAIGKDFIYWHKSYEALKGVHAGLRRGELTIPLIIKKAR